MRGGHRDAPVNSSPAVAANAEGEEIEVLESTEVLPVAPEDVSLRTRDGSHLHMWPLSYIFICTSDARSAANLAAA